MRSGSLSKAPLPFAVWITGLPASGKSTVAKALAGALFERGVNVAVLESDALRRIFTPRPRYDEAERESFYGSMTYIGRLLTEHGVSVIFDATANLRVYRDGARKQIPRFLEVYVDAPLDLCVARDPKGIYRAAKEKGANTVPGLQAPYEPPIDPDVTVRGDREAPEAAARRIVSKLIERGYLEKKEGQ
jgi:adenylylsulfate kinase